MRDFWLFAGLFLLLSIIASTLGVRAEVVDRVRAVERVSEFMRNGDTTGLRSAFNDSVLVHLTVEGMAATRADWINNFGTLKEVTPAEFDEQDAAFLTLVFEQVILEVALDFDTTGRISFVSVAPAPQPTTSGLDDSSQTNSDSALIHIESLKAYASLFNSDSGTVRFVALLSPT